MGDSVCEYPNVRLDNKIVVTLKGTQLGFFGCHFFLDRSRMGKRGAGDGRVMGEVTKQNWIC